MSDIIYQPSPWQQRFHATTQQGINEVLGAGSAGPGKTFCLANDCNDQIIVEHERCENKKHKHHQAWGSSTGWALHLRRTRLNLEQTIVLSRRLFKSMDPGAEWNEQKATWTFSSGFKYQFGHCKDPNDWENFSSFSLTALFFDELTEFDEEQYDQICRRVRSNDPVLKLMLKIRSMSNPLMRRTAGQDFTVKDPNWVRRRFVDAAPEGNVVFKRKLTRRDGTVGWHKWLYMPAKLQDNPDKEFVANYELNLLNSPAHIRAALLDGNWYVTAGSFFAEYWRKELHTCKPFKCPRDWRFFRSMDWGFKAPGCIHWFAMDEDETLYVIRELKFQNKLDTEVAEMVKVIEKDLGLWDERAHRSRITGVADTQIWEKRGQTGPSIGDNFYAKGVGWERASKGPGSNQLHAQNIIKRLSDHDFGTKTPGLVIFESCQYIIKTLPAIQTNPDNGEEPASGGDDHAYDCLRGDSLVTTATGPVPIRAVRHGDLVMSTDGRFYPCESPRLVRKNAELLRVDLGGAELIATPNHRVLCADGTWRRVDELRTGMYAFSPWSQLSSVKRSKNLREPAITSAGFTSSATAFGCIALSGSGQMESQSRLDTTFTMKMRTDPTTLRGISSCLQDRSMVGIMRRGKISIGFEKLPLKEWSWPRSGTEAQRGLSGIVSMLLNRSVNLAIRALQIAEFALSRSWTIALAAGGSTAPALATRNSVEMRGSTTLSEYALPVGKLSWQTGMVVPRLVHGDAVRVCGVVPAEPADVYCMTVPGMGAFVAEGVVVSNCLKYGVTRATRGRGGIPETTRTKALWEEEDEQAASPKRGRHGYGQELC